MDSVIITGSNRGLGLEFVRQYAADGWRVFAGARRVSVELEQIAASNSNVSIHLLDIADHGAIGRLANDLSGSALDVLINNAGILGKVSLEAGALRDQAFGHTDYEDWERIFRVNVMGTMKMTEAFAGHVAGSRQKKIVALSSVLGSMTLNNTGGFYGYRASKAAVNAIVKSMAIDLAPLGIIAAALHPGWARTEMGGRNAVVTVPDSVSGMRRVISALSPEDAGKMIAYDGGIMAY